MKFNKFRCKYINCNNTMILYLWSIIKGVYMFTRIRHVSNVSIMIDQSINFVHPYTTIISQLEKINEIKHKFISTICINLYLLAGNDKQ